MQQRARYTAAWTRFKRMQRAACLFAVLVYAAAAVHAWRVLPGGAGAKRAFILMFPSVYLVAAGVIPLQIAFLRRRLKRYVWLSFASGFGQTVISVLTGFGVLGVAAGLIYWQIASASRGGAYPASIFSAYAAGIGILIAQVLLSRRLELEPKVRAIIEG